MNQLERTLTSNEVAEMVGRRHDQVMRDIETIKNHLGDHKNVESYFIESSYKNIQNKEYPNYLLTKKGCELYATRMTGEKGTQFAVAYIERFNDMEQKIEQEKLPMTIEDMIIKQAQSVKEIRNDVTMLKDTMRIDGVQEHQISRLGKSTVVKALGGIKSPAYEELSSKVFARFWRDFKNHFMLPRYGELPKAQFDEAVYFINLWRPSTSTQIEIDNCNRQMFID